MTEKLLTSTVFLLCGVLTSASGQAVFSASPGAGITSASFGIESERIVPYVGIDVVWLSFDVNTSDSDVDMYSSNGYLRRYETSNEKEINCGANLVIPHFGMKLILRDDEDIRTFLNGKFFFSIPFVNVSGSETRRSYYWEDYYPGAVPDDSYVYTDKYEMNEDAIKDVLSFVGLSFGYGAEYKFSEHFSVGSEFGLQILLNSFKDSDSNTSNWYDETHEEEWSAELKGALRLTYVKLTLAYKS